MLINFLAISSNFLATIRAEYIDLCHAIPKLVCEIGLINTDSYQKAIDVAINFRQLFEKYAKCHQKLNSRNVFDGNQIAEFSTLACFTTV